MCKERCHYKLLVIEEFMWLTTRMKQANQHVSRVKSKVVCHIFNTKQLRQYELLVI